MAKKVTPYNLDRFGPGTLIKTYDKLDEVDTEDTDKVIQATQFQAKIGQELEGRGWVYDDAASDWVYYL